MTSKPAISIEKAYYAGLADGEGYFYLVRGSVKKSKIYIKAGFKICMIDETGILSKAYELWGGWLKDNKARNDRSRPTKEWVLTGKALDKFIEDLLPYLKGKQQQAEIIQEFRSFVSYTNNITDKVQLYRQHLFNGLIGLHHSISFEIDQQLRSNALEDITQKRFISRETRERLSESHRGQIHAGSFKKGGKPWTTGKHLSQEHKLKISEANKIALKKYYAKIKI